MTTQLEVLNKYKANARHHKLFNQDCEISPYLLALKENKKMSRQPIRHELKVHPQYFREIKVGRKNWELRLNDRDFQLGDFLYLREYDPIEKTYTGNELDNLEIIYILSGYYALAENHVIISFPPIVN